MNSTIHHGFLALFLSATLLSGEGPVFAESLNEIGKISLQGTLERFTEESYLLKKYQTRWQATDADIDQLLNRDGWTLELGGRKEFLQGNRLETRNDTLGRSPRRDYDRVDEREDYLKLGVSNSFLEETRRKKADAIQERTRRLDDVAKFDLLFREATLNAALAFTGAYYGRIVLRLTEEELSLLEENLHATEARLEQEEALTVDVLEEKTKIANVHRRLASLRIKLRKRMDYLRDLWGYPDLEPEMLAVPDLPEVTSLASLSLNELVEKGLAQRDDIESSLKAKQLFLRSSEYTNVLPEVDLSLSSRYGHFDRDFADEGRHDTTYDLRLDLEVSVPLSIKRRNEARTRRFHLKAKERDYEILAKREAIRNEIQDAFEDYLLSREEVKVQKLLLDQEVERERMTRITVETMPEAVKGDPARKLRQVRRDRIRAEIDYHAALRERLENTLILLSYLGDLSPDYRHVITKKVELER